MTNSSQCHEECRKLNWVFRLLVFAQFLLVAILVVAGFESINSWLAIAVSITGFVIGVWALHAMGRYFNASPRLRKDAPLRTTGPYRFVRHPMYLALLTFCAGFVIGAPSLYTISLWSAIAVVLAIKMRYEEQLLRKRFADYEVYANKTKRLIPFLF